MELCTGLVNLSWAAGLYLKPLENEDTTSSDQGGEKKTLSSLTETEQSENHLLLMAKHNKEDKAGDIDKF